MKKALLIAGALILAVALWAFVIRPAAHSTSSELSLMRDKTDKNQAKPKERELWTLLNLDHDKWQRSLVRTQAISNVDYNHVHTAELPSKLLLLSNPSTRDAEIYAFKQKIIAAIDTIEQQPTGLATSSIYRPVMEELNRLSLSKATRKLALIYSDLFVNTDVFSIYKKEHREWLKQHPEEVQKMLESTLSPGDLHGITVYLMHQPGNEFENENFRLMSDLFTRILTGAGAKVIVGANVTGQAE